MSTERKTPGQVLYEATELMQSVHIPWDEQDPSAQDACEYEASAVIRDFCQRVRERAIEESNAGIGTADMWLIHVFNELAKEHEK
jgi:hypothetical protein